MRCGCRSFGWPPIVDMAESRLWEAIALVGTEAPNPYAREAAENARNVAAEGDPERLRMHLLYMLSFMSKWKGRRATRIKAILREYARPKEMK